MDGFGSESVHIITETEILEAQKLTDSMDPDPAPDPEHCDPYIT
jgi:hypothetical protein